MTAILSELPKTYNDSAKIIIQQHLRRNTSGTNSPSSPLSCSSPKLLLSPQLGPFSSLQNHHSSERNTRFFYRKSLLNGSFVCLSLGPRSRQSSVEANDGTPPMNTEEVYRSLRKTTAEIQSYTLETKLGLRDSKDSGINQMEDQSPAAGVAEPPMQQQQQAPLHYYSLHQPKQFPSNGYNGHMNIDINSCNGSNTQSATTTESNTPENTVRMEGDINPSRNAFTPKHSNNVTFLPNGELVTECK